MQPKDLERRLKAQGFTDHSRTDGPNISSNLTKWSLWMTEHNSVLVYGTGPQIQETQWILQFFDSDIFLSPGLSDLAELPETSALDLLIFWDSTSLEEREGAMLLASKRWPASKSLVLSAKTAIRASTLLSKVGQVLKVD
jgi:hypothetical protein